jgi:hypothetical protein
MWSGTVDTSSQTFCLDEQANMTCSQGDANDMEWQQGEALIC